MRVGHHELCFGCGLANLFGLQLEADAASGHVVSGRFFVKQDHQGPRGEAHAGIVATALEEAMSLAVSAGGAGVGQGTARRLEVALLAPAPVGAHATVRAWVESREGDAAVALAELAADGRPVATARAEYLASRRDVR